MLQEATVLIGLILNVSPLPRHNFPNDLVNLVDGIKLGGTVLALFAHEALLLARALEFQVDEVLLLAWSIVHAVGARHELLVVAHIGALLESFRVN